MATTIGGNRNRWKELRAQLVAFFTIRRPEQKLYTTYTRRLQLINQVREMKRKNVKDLRERLNFEFK